MPTTSSIETDDTDISQQQGRLLQLLYRCPVGVAGVGNSGTVILLNALGTALLAPIAGANSVDNFFDLMRPHAPEFVEVLEKSSRVGEVCQDRWILTHQAGVPVQLSFTVTRIDRNALMIAFKDLTSVIAAERRIREALEAQAVQTGRAEMAANVLHDIGNAITGIGTRSAQMAAEPPWPEVENLSRLSTVLQSQNTALAATLGERKANALVGLAAALERSLRQRETSLRENVRAFVHSVSHVSDILAVQRQYVRHGGTGSRSKVLVDDLIQDALAIHSAALEKREVKLVIRMKGDLPPLKLDRTRMIQVIGNVILNAAQSFDGAVEMEPQHSLELRAEHGDQGGVRLTFKDNGCGFSQEQAPNLFQRGATTKAEGSGLGLSSSRSTVDSHGGQIRIESEGVGRGATVIIDLPADLPGAEEEELR